MNGLHYMYQMIKKVEKISNFECKDWIINKHYAKRMCSISYAYGLFIDGQLNGVCTFDEAERGFSTRFEGDLDMRMNQRSKISAKEVVNTYSEEKLADILFMYGEIRNSKNVAKTILYCILCRPKSRT